jgi:hypothetical protein
MLAPQINHTLVVDIKKFGDDYNRFLDNSKKNDKIVLNHADLSTARKYVDILIKDTSE